MKLPIQAVPVYRYVSSSSLVKISNSMSYGIKPQVTYQQKEDAQNYIRENCHNLQHCSDTQLCRQLRNQGETANMCAWKRFVVREYFLERNIPDNGDHQEAIRFADEVANRCFSLWRRDCTVRGVLPSIRW